jgi:hypothetical protein
MTQEGEKKWNYIDRAIRFHPILRVIGRIYFSYVQGFV